jgi:hypothetical protein
VENSLHLHLLDGDRRVEERFEVENPYLMEMDEFARCIEAGGRPTSDAENAQRNLALIEEVQRKQVLLPF